MASFLATVCFSLLFVLPLGVLAQGGGCEGQREHLLSLLREGVERTQRRVQEIRESAVLSEMSRGDFTQSAEWLIAWLRDQSERLERGADCEELEQLRSDAKAQIIPVYLASLRAHAAHVLWEIDRLLPQLPQEDAAASARERLQEAREAFRELRESGIMPLEEFRVRMRRAIFLAEQGLRFLRLHGTME